jgi:hypothetical protein
MAFDEHRGRLVLFGGYDGVVYLQDTWEWNGTTWTPVATGTGPAARVAPAMAYDPVRQVTWLFGGANTNSLGDLWAWNGVSWMQPSVGAGPAPRQQTAMTFDPNRNAMILFGGIVQNGQQYTPVDDTWICNGQTWQLLQPATPPYRRGGHRMVTDTARRRVVLLGGAPFDDPFAWEWDGIEWQCVLVSSPTPRSFEALAYDTARHEVVLFGGSASNYYWNDTWIYRTAQLASFVSYGQGCAGSAGTPALTAAPYSLPWLGDTFRSRVDAVPATGAGAVFVTGFASTPAQSLAPFGMAGCASYVTLDSSQFVLATAGIAEWSIQIPANMALAGWLLYQQALVLDPASPGGAVVSNAASATVGIR